MQGSIKTMVSQRGFGFIKGDDGEDYFLHISNFNPSTEFKELKVGDRISFSDCESDRGLCAEDAELA